MEFTITNATKADAPFIAESIMGAIGEEICADFGGGKERLPLVKELFTELARKDNSQYSYLNTFVARDADGNQLGAVIAYDGALLHPLRKEFVKQANITLGWNRDVDDDSQWKDETEPGEIYLDTLFVTPKARRNGIGAALIGAVIDKYNGCGKPVGLLTEPSNTTAHRLYFDLGFKMVGTNDFFGFPMLHLQRQ